MAAPRLRQGQNEGFAAVGRRLVAGPKGLAASRREDHVIF